MRVALVFAALILTGCATGLEDNQANQTNTVAGMEQENHGTIITVTSPDGTITVTEPYIVDQPGEIRTDGPFNHSLIRTGPRYVEVVSESNIYAGSDFSGREVVSNSPFDIVDVDFRRPFPTDLGPVPDGPMAIEDLNSSIRGIYTGDVRIEDTNNDGYPDLFTSSKSEVVKALGGLVTAYNSQRLAIIEATKITETTRIKEIGELQRLRAEMLGKAFTEFNESVRAVATGGVSELPGVLGD